jgi:methionyl-tRNA synthetase
MEAFELHKAVEAVFDLLYESNRYIQEISPWLSSCKPEDVHRALFYVSESLRVAGVLLTPFMPEKSQVLLDALGVSKEGRKWETVGMGQGGPRVAKVSRHLFDQKVKLSIPSSP